MRRRPEIQSLVDAERQQQARAYGTARRRLTLISSFLGPLYLLAWLVTGFHQRLDETLAPHLSSPVLRAVVFFLVLGLGWWLLHLAVAIPTHRLARAYGLSTQNWEDWFTDQIKAGLIAAPIGALIVAAIYVFIGTGQPEWWLWAFFVVVVVQVVLTIVGPVLIAPIFFRFEPLEDEELRERFLRLAQRAGVPAANVYRFDMSRRTRAANAAVIGMGATRRIVIADTLTETFSPDEAETVLAHELAHHVHRDIVWGFLLNSLVMFVSLWAVAQALAWAEGRGLIESASPQSLPLLLLVLLICLWAFSPLVNLWSRTREMLADMFAIDVTGRGDTYARALARLADQNLAELWPPHWYVWLYGTHPPLGERIALALERAENRIASPRPDK